MRLTHSRTPKIYSYELGGHILQYTNNHTYLGIDICNNLSWNKHINRIVSSASRSLGFIKRNLYSCPKHIKATAYLTLVRPLLEYSSSVWDPHSQDLINKLERVQRRAARFVVNDYSRHSSVSVMLNQLDWAYSVCQLMTSCSRSIVRHGTYTPTLTSSYRPTKIATNSATSQEQLKIGIHFHLISPSRIQSYSRIKSWNISATQPRKINATNYSTCAHQFLRA